MTLASPRSALLAAVVLMAGIGTAANATTISPISATKLSGTAALGGAHPLSVVIDGVVDFDQWYGFVDPGGTIRFDLGGSFDLTGFNIWNNGGFIAGDGEAVNAYSLAFRDDTLGILGSSSGILADVLTMQSASFSATGVAFVDLNIIGSHSGPSYSLFHEINFEGAATAVPESATFALLCLGLIGMGLRERKKLD